MFFIITSVLLPVLLVFGLYHLMTWFNIFHINERVYWKRAALAAAISHVLLVTGFIVFTYYYFTSGGGVDNSFLTFGAFLFNRSEFWRLALIFDTAAMFVVLGLFALLQRLQVNPPGVLLITFGIVYIVGSVQWYFVGGGVGALVERLWEGLKTPDEEQDEEWE